MLERGQKGKNASYTALIQLSVASSATHKLIGLFWCWFPGGWVCVHSRTLWVSPTNSPVRLGVSPTTPTPTGFYGQKFLRLSFPTLEPWVAWSVSLPSCSSQFIYTQMWDHTVCQPQPCPPRSSSHHLAGSPLCPSCPSAPLLLVWMIVSSFTPWLSGFHTVQFSGSSGYFFHLNLLLSFFWLCEEAKYIYLHHCIGQKSTHYTLISICISISFTGITTAWTQSL